MVEKLNKGFMRLKPGAKVFKKKDPVAGKRKVWVDERTCIYTDCATDEEAIARFHARHPKPKFGRLR